ncbi:MAG: M14 family zinc carboxypeptidase [Planctomycetota bacterium]
MKRACIVAVSLLLIGAAAATGEATIEIDTDYENGHLVDYRIVGPDTIRVGPLNPNRHRWFSFRIKGVEHRRIRFIFEWTAHDDLPLVLRVKANDTAMVTYDGKGYEIVKDSAWRPNEPGATSGGYHHAFSHVFREDEALVAYAAPWSNTTLAELTGRLAGDRRVTTETIGRSRFRKLPLRYFRVTDPDAPDDDKRRILILAREDSYEVGGSWVAEGMIRFLLSDDPVARAMLRRTTFIIFPLFSADGVAMGHTNFPLSADGGEYVYLPGHWAEDPPYHEVSLMKAFWRRLKADGKDLDLLMRPHSTCYFQPHFRPGCYSEANALEAERLFATLLTRLPWRVKARRSQSPAGTNYAFNEVFPDAISMSQHDDFVFPASFLGTDTAVIRRHEDVVQDGELIVRALAEHDGIPSRSYAPCLMAGDVDRNAAAPGETVTFSVYYYDIHGRPPERVELHVNGKSYRMRGPEAADYSRPVRFEYDLAITDAANDYSFTASNGRRERTVPEGYHLPGPFLCETQAK